MAVEYHWVLRGHPEHRSEMCREHHHLAQCDRQVLLLARFLQLPHLTLEVLYAHVELGGLRDEKDRKELIERFLLPLHVDHLA